MVAPAARERLNRTNPLDETPGGGDGVWEDLGRYRSGTGTGWEGSMARFVAPPGWPAPPAGWVPPAGWEGDPSWPPPPDGWQFWVEDGPGNSVVVPEPNKGFLATRREAKLHER